MDLRRIIAAKADQYTIRANRHDETADVCITVDAHGRRSMALGPHHGNANGNAVTKYGTIHWSAAFSKGRHGNVAGVREMGKDPAPVVLGPLVC